jgi:hypothetical protein
MERLRHVVVRARLQAFDLVLPAIARGQHQDREGLLRGACAADQLEPRQLREPEVDDRDVERVFERGEEPLLAVGRDVHGESRFREPRPQRLAQGSLVLNDEYAHRKCDS